MGRPRKEQNEVLQAQNTTPEGKVAKAIVSPNGHVAQIDGNTFFLSPVVEGWKAEQGEAVEINRYFASALSHICMQYERVLKLRTICRNYIAESGEEFTPFHRAEVPFEAYDQIATLVAEYKNESLRKDGEASMMCAVSRFYGITQTPQNKNNQIDWSL